MDMTFDSKAHRGCFLMDSLILCNVFQSNLKQKKHKLFCASFTEPTLIQTAPSLIASACICSAVRGLKLPFSNAATRDVCHLTHVDPINLELLVRFIDQQVEKVVPQVSERAASPSNKLTTNNDFESPTYGQPETPTEVESIYF